MRPERRGLLPAAARTALLLAGLAPLLPAAGSLALLAPGARASLAAGSLTAIRWNAAGVCAPVRLTLWRAGRFAGVIAGPLPADRGEYAWAVGLVQGGVAEAGAGYVVRVETQDGSLAASGGAFAIRPEPRLRSVQLTPRIINAHRRNRWDNGHDQCLFAPQAEPADLPEEPPEWTARAGYRNRFRTWNECELYDGLIFRAYLYFELPPDAAGAVGLRARLTCERQDDAPPGAAPWPLRLFAVTEPWSGPATPRDPSFAVALGEDGSDLTDLLRRWLGGGWAATGLLITGPDETYAHDNEYRLSLLGNIRLQVEYLSKHAPVAPDPRAPFRP